MLLDLDAGERDDEPEELWAQFDILAIACGGHAGDTASMQRVVAACKRGGIAIGAHPAYADREGFGRRSLEVPPKRLVTDIEAQCAALAAIAAAATMPVRYIKPHGALYHDAARDRAIAAAVLGGAMLGLAGRVAVIGPPTGALRDVATQLGHAYLREGFADRRRRADGSLVPRSEPDALITDVDEAVAQARAIAPTVDAICVHADTPNALAIARALRAAFTT